MKYVNILAGLKFWVITILVSLFLICVLVIICLTIAQTIDEKRKTRLLKSYGCERYVSGVPSLGSSAFYSWKTADYKINLDERDIMRMSYKRLKEILKDTFNKERKGK